MEQTNAADTNNQSLADPEFNQIANYVYHEQNYSELAWSTAIDCLKDAFACYFFALKHPDCLRLMGPIVPQTIVPDGVPIPGTIFKLDPIQAAFSISAAIRWLDFNDTWLAKEWGHPSDNLGAILAVADFVTRNQMKKLTVKHILAAMIKAYEIQGIFSLENSLNALGLDHVAFVKTASAALAMQLLGGTQSQIVDVLSQVWVDGQSLRTYRHAPNTGSRKSWAAADAASRGVRLAWLIHWGEMGYPTALSAKKWGYYDVTQHGQPFQFSRPFGCYVMENILFKVSYPAEFHAQTAVECAVILHPKIKHKLDKIKKITLTTQQSAIRIISKTGPLYNYADRDHCLQYMVAVALLTGHLQAENYSDDFARNPKIDWLRDKMIVIEDPVFTKEYLDPEKRSIANQISIDFNDGSNREEICIEYPLGHKKRRAESQPLLQEKFYRAITEYFSKSTTNHILKIFSDKNTLVDLPVTQLMELFCGK